MISQRKLDEIVLSAVTYIERKKDKSMRPYVKTIASFIMGAKMSPFYPFFQRHKDVCGTVKRISEEVVLDSLLRLERQKKLNKELSNSGKYAFSLVNKKQKTNKTNSSKTTRSKITKFEKNSYFLIFNPYTSETKHVGKIQSFNKREKIIVDASTGRKYDAEVAKPISKEEYHTISKQLKNELPNKTKGKRNVKNSTKQKEESGEVVFFYESCKDSEKKILRQFKKVVENLLPDHELQNNRSTYGFAPIEYDGEFPKKRCWITRDKESRKLILKFKKEPESSEKQLPLYNDRQVTEAIRQLRVAYSTSAQDIEAIVNRIKNKDTFSDYLTDNLKDITLMPHQKAGVELSNEYNRFAYFYDTGTGKTIMALEIMAKKHSLNNARFLVVAPKALIKSAWMEDSLHFKGIKLLPLSKNITKEDYARIYDEWELMNGKRRIFTDEDGNLLDKIPLDFLNEELIPDLMKRADHFIINIDAIRQPKDGNKLLKQVNCDGLIIDESVIIKNRDSGNAIRMRVFAKKMKYVYLLSGKPAPNSTIEYFSQMEIVDPDTFNMTFNAFVSKYYKTVGYNKLVDKNDSTRKEVAKMVANRSIIVAKEDCIELPPAMHKKIGVELDDATKDFYKDVMENFVTEIIDMEGKKVRVNQLSRLASIMKLREIASGFYLNEDNSYRINKHKVNAIKDLVEEIGYDQYGKHNKILIWCTFKYEIKILEAELRKDGYKVVTAYSETGRMLDNNIRDFKNGDADIMIAHPQTLKYGVTFVKCHYCIYSSMSYSYDDYKQSHDRIYRNGQKELCIFYHMLSENTIDENIYRVVVDKSNRSKIFESLVKSASKHGIKREIIDKALRVNAEIKNAVTSKKELDDYSA